MPDFVLAKQIYELTRNIDWAKYGCMVLMYHGVLSFADDDRQSYENVTDLVSRAERYIDNRQG